MGKTLGACESISTGRREIGMVDQGVFEAMPITTGDDCKSFWNNPEVPELGWMAIPFPIAI